MALLQIEIVMAVLAAFLAGAACVSLLGGVAGQKPADRGDHAQ